MADQTEKMKKGLLKDILKEMKGTNERFEKIAQAEMDAAAEGRGLIGGAYARAKAREKLAKEWMLATKGTIDRRSAFFEGMGIGGFGKALDVFFPGKKPTADAELIKKFGLDKKDKNQKKFSDKNFAKPISLILKSVIETKKMVQNIEKSLTKTSLKSGYTFDPRMAGGGRYRNLATNKLASASEATQQAAQIARTDRLTKMIAADEDPMIRIADSLEGILKTLGDPESRTVHRKLDMILDGDSGGFDLPFRRMGGGGGVIRDGRRRKPISKKVNDRYKRRFGQNAPGYGKRTGGMRGGVGIGGLLGAAAGGFVAYKAVDALRDPTLQSYDPELLKEEANILSDSGDLEAKQALQDQIAAQKQDVKIQAAATTAAGVGAVGGALAVKKIAQSTVVKNINNKTWNLFLKFLEKRSPSLAAKVGARLAAAGGLALVPLVGWVSAAISIVGTAWLAYDLYLLWQEFSTLSEAEQLVAASGKPSKEVNDWAYSVFIGKATLNDVPSIYREQVGEILKNPPGNWKKPKVVTAKPQVPLAPKPTTVAPTTSTSPVQSALSTVKESVSRAISAGGAATMATGAAVGAGGAVISGAARKGTDKVKDIIVAAAKRIGVNPGIMLAMGQQESSFNPSAQPYYTDKKTGERKLLSSAKGIFQFINSTWDSMVQKYSKAYPELLKGAFDPEANALAGALYVKENSEFLKKRNIPVDGTSIYATHFLGPGGAARLLSAPKESIAANIMPAPAASNPHIFYDRGRPKTVQEVIDTLYKKVGSKAESFQAQVDSGRIGAPVMSAPSQTMLASTTTETPGVLSASTSSRTPGSQMAAQSTELERSRMVASTTQSIAPVVINNAGNNKMPPQSPKQPLPMASTRPSESAFNRAISKDFAHPTSFTSSVVV